MISTYGYVVNKDQEPTGTCYLRTCNSWVGQVKRDGKKLYMCIPSDSLPKGKRNRKYIEAWSKFAEEAGFKNKFVGAYRASTFEGLNKSTSNIRKSRSRATTWYLIEFEYNNYLSGKHALAGWSVMRYSMSEYYSYNKIPEAAMMLKKKYPEWDHYECLMIAHYTTSAYYSYYGIKPDTTSFLLTKKEYLKGLTKAEATSVHKSATLHSKYSAFKNSVAYRREFEKLFAEGKYEEIYNTLKGKGKLSFRGLCGQQFRVIKGDAGIAKGAIIEGRAISVRKKIVDAKATKRVGRTIYKNTVEQHLEFIKDNGKTRTINIDRLKKV